MLDTGSVRLMKEECSFLCLGFLSNTLCSANCFPSSFTGVLLLCCLLKLLWLSIDGLLYVSKNSSEVCVHSLLNIIYYIECLVSSMPSNFADKASISLV